MTEGEAGLELADGYYRENECPVLEQDAGHGSAYRTEAGEAWVLMRQLHPEEHDREAGPGDKTLTGDHSYPQRGCFSCLPTTPL